jgi:hypothetical protein
MLDFNGIERVQIAAWRSDNIVINDLPAPASQVAIDLAATGTSYGDYQSDRDRQRKPPEVISSLSIAAAAPSG